MNRPFALSMTPEIADDQVAIFIQLENAPEAKILDHIDEAVQAFFRLMGAGGGQGHKFNPALTVTPAVQRRVHGAEIHYLAAPALPDPQAITILINILHWLGVRLAPIAQLRIGCRSVTGYRNDAFPIAWPSPPFEWIEDDDLPGAFVIEAIFGRNASAEDQEQLFNHFANWLLVAHRGGFAASWIRPPESVIFLGPDVMEIDAARARFYIDVMRCDFDAARDCLLNVLCWYSSRICPILSVTLD